jgi:hypothetical protein
MGPSLTSIVTVVSSETSLPGRDKTTWKAPVRTFRSRLSLNEFLDMLSKRLIRAAMGKRRRTGGRRRRNTRQPLGLRITVVVRLEVAFGKSRYLKRTYD